MKIVSDVHRPDIQVGDRVRVLHGSRAGDEGRVVIRKPVEVPLFGRSGVVFEVDFGDCPRIEQGYYTTQYQPQHLERIDP